MTRAKCGVIPLTRREFLAAGVESLAAMGLASQANDQTPAKPEFTFALVSDTHVGRGGEGPSRNMALAVQEINASPAQFTVFGGDLVDNGMKPENERRYPEWAEIAGRLKKPFYAVPGNHDPEDRFKQCVRKETDFAFDHERFRFICFQDTRCGNHDGFVQPEQVEWLQAKRDEAVRRKQLVILVAHVTRRRNAHPDVGWWVKQGEQELGELLEQNAQTVCAFFAGHFQCGLRGWSDHFGVQEVVMPSLAWNNNRGLDKAPGYALTDFRVGYAMADVFPDRILLQYKPLSAPPKESRELKR